MASYPILPQQEYGNGLGKFNRTAAETIEVIERVIESAKRVAEEGAFGLPPNPSCLRLCLADIMAIIEGRI